MTGTTVTTSSATPSPTPELRGISRAAAVVVLVASLVAAGIGIAVVRTDPGAEPALVAPGIPTADDEGTESDRLVALGEAYLAGHPDEADGPTLLAELGLAADAVGDLNAQLDAFDGQIADEVRAGDTVELDGEVVAITEARIAALLALQARAQQAAATSTTTSTTTATPVGTAP